MSTNRATATTYVRTRLGDLAKTIWLDDGSETEIAALLREGQYDLCARTLMLWRKSSPASLDDVAGAATASLPSDTYLVERMTWQNRALGIYDARWLEYNSPAFETLQGNGVYSIVMDGDGLMTIRKVPVPGTTQAGNYSLEDFYLPGALTLSTDTFSIPDRYVKYVCWFTISRCFERDGPGQNLKAADHYKGRYADGIRRVNQRRDNFLAERESGMRGGAESGRGRAPGLPVLPWNYGRVIRPRR